jgi:hypothetical protein
MMRFRLTLVVLATAPWLVYPARGQEPLFQTSFATDQELAGWTHKDRASVSSITRRVGTRSLLIQQWADDQRDSHWLSPVIANPGGGPAAAEGAKIAVDKVKDGYVYEWCYLRQFEPIMLQPIREGGSALPIGNGDLAAVIWQPGDLTVMLNKCDIGGVASQAARLVFFHY